jgi:hypothetical protein
VLGLGTELKLGQAPLFKCSEAVLEGLEAENGLQMGRIGLANIVVSTTQLMT